MEKRVCSNCSFEETREIEASHNWKSWETTTPATCLVDGEKTRECRECDATETETIKAQGHVKEITTEAKEPTATEAGSTEGAKCANCDYVYSTAIELSKLGNLVSIENIKVTEGEDWWGFSDTKYYIADGDNATATRSPKGASYELTITLKDDAFVKDITVVCNGKGTIYDKWGKADVTEIQYNIKKVAITCYKDGEVVDVQNFDDTTELTEVKLEGVETYVDTIEIYVESAIKNEGTAVIWEINAYGTAPITECDKNGHKFGEWVPEVEVTCEADGSSKRTCSECGLTEERVDKTEGHTWSKEGVDAYGEVFKKAPTCSEEGYIGKMCTRCYVTSTEKIPTIPHDWDAWVVLSGDCVSGATRTRQCKVCETPETETSAPGEHANIIYEGAKAPTKTEDGSTGVKKCAACNTKLEDAKILRIVNAALDATLSTSGTHWHVVGNATNKPALLHLTDGNYETGVPSCSSTVGSMRFTLEFDEALDIYEVIVVCNGKGSLGGLGTVNEITNFNIDITVAFKDEAGEIIFTETKNTLDKIQLTFNNNTGKAIKEIIVSYPHKAYVSNTLYLWEVEAFAEKALTACEASGTHAWGEWTGTEPVCSQEGLTDGVKTRECSVCGETETQTTPATHSFGAWDETNVSCATGGVRTKTCSSCGKVESETIPAGNHVETELQGAKEPTFEEDGSTGALVCTKCGETVEEAKVIPKLVNEAANATPTVEAWVVVPTYINDGDMTTGVTGYVSQPDSTVHVLTWSSAVSIDVIKLYFNGETTDKKLGANIDRELPDRYNNTNVGVDLTVKIYGENGDLIKTAIVNTLDKTEDTIVLDQVTQITKIEIVNRHSWSAGNCVNIWEVQAYKTYKAEE